MVAGLESLSLTSFLSGVDATSRTSAVASISETNNAASDALRARRDNPASRTIQDIVDLSPEARSALRSAEALANSFGTETLLGFSASVNFDAGVQNFVDVRSDQRGVFNAVASELFAGASFVGQDLRGGQFYQADLTGTDFSGALLDDADFTNADVTGATFDGANLSGADLSTAIGLTFDQILGARLSGTTLLPSDIAERL